MSALETELKSLIVEALMLDDVTPEEIDEKAPLFGEGEGLALDSIDALELAIAIDKRYGVKISADDKDNKKTFSSVVALAAYIEAHRAKESTP